MGNKAIENLTRFRKVGIFKHCEDHHLQTLRERKRGAKMKLSLMRFKSGRESSNE